ncbi:MAG: hypothetical protein ACRD3A_11330 [Terriglobales bacterium]
MRKWYLPLTVLGVAGLAALVLSERARESVRRIVGRLDDAPEPFRGWNDAAQRELESLQEALERLSDTLHAVR